MTGVRSIFIAVFVISTLGAVGPIRADDQAPIKLTLHPAAEPTPALKYRLLPPFTDEIPGNAAVYYGKIAAEETPFFTNRTLWDKIEDVWPDMPLDQLRREDLHPAGWPIYFLEQGAKCKYCDWQFPIGDVPYYTMILPEAQESRRYARMLAVKARWEIAQGKFDEAVKTFQTNYALARNVAEGETLVNGLVGIAMCGHMFPQISEFIQQPASPNLYWALTNLPTPLIDVRKAIDVESDGLELSFPELRNLETARRTPEEWRELHQRFAKQAVEMAWTSDSEPQLPSPEELDKACQDVFPAAKRALIDGGRSREHVEAMSVHQVALLYTLQLYHEMFDEAAKYYFLPYPQAIEGIDAAIARTERIKEIIPLAALNAPANRPTRLAIARNDRQIAVLRVFEALRIYGASHQGNLPEQLSDVTQVPIPDDPVTGRPFDYRRKGDNAFLRGPGLGDPARSSLNVPLKYEITMVRPK